GEHRRVRRDNSIAAARPDHRDGCNLRFAALAMFLQRPAEGLVGEDAREIVHAAVALGFADDGDHLVRGELPARNAGLEPGGILHIFQLDLCDLDRHGPCPGARLTYTYRYYESLRGRGGSTLGRATRLGH